jgi:ABC-type nitrate/sulfonate/bicarbonate transport system substrate-binding protein
MQRPQIRRSSRLLGAGVTLIALAVALSASPAVAASHATKSDKAETASLAVPLIASSAAEGYEIFAAQEGFYKPYGLTVTTPDSDAGDVEAAIVSGGTPLDGLSGTDFLNLVSSGYPVETIGCSVSKNPFQMYAQSSVTDIKGLIGKTIGTTSIGSAHQVAEEEFLEKNGVKASQVTFVALGSVPDILAALESGQIAAGGLSYPFYATAAQNTKLHKLGLAPVPTELTVANSTWAKKNANTIEAYIKGTNEGLAAYSTDEKAALPVLATFLGLSMSNPTDAATVKAGFETYQPPKTGPIVACTTSDLKPYLPFLTPVEQAKVKDLSKLFDNAYVNSLASQNFYQTLTKKYGKIPGFPTS